MGKLHAVVTQNVDGLHQKAGTAVELVVEVHGTIWWTRCWDCQDRRPMDEVLDRVRAGEEDPPCEVCGGILKSDTISFGQSLVPEVIDRAMRVSEECDLLLAVGSTLSVYPAANCVPRAKATGARVVIVNGGPTDMDRLADAVLNGQIGDTPPGPRRRGRSILTGVEANLAGIVVRTGRPEYPTRAIGFPAWPRSEICWGPPRPRSPRSTPPVPPSASTPGRWCSTSASPTSTTRAPCPARVHIPRGHLEAQVEGRLTDKTAPVVVYCAGGVRSAFAARTLQELGYADVVSMDGGFGRWKDEGRPWKQPVVLTADQRNRYMRHILLPEVGTEGQAKLLGSKVLLLGAGGLGSPAALYLAAAGVGTIGIVDMDEVDASNLQRQILHNLDRIGDRKVDSAKKTLTLINPDVDVVTYDTRLSAENIIDIITGYDVIVDGADNFPSRYLLNDASVKLGIPVVHGSIFRFEGMVSVFHPLEGPTYRDMVPEPPPAELAPSCAEAGVLGVLPGIVGSIQALETIKVLLGLGEPLIGRILSIDTTDMSFRTFNLKPDPANEVTYENRDRIQVRDLDGLCAPWLDDH